ncbi:hypothetical protein CPIN17260_0753 [Campylobacter pinnipediorum subsp. pinnipediorum]|uniref:hypothetical protein n=1 Tax=Campylobacter pinnipediorum TaxID=1965231 RepID=UPI000994E175|nr:hypothetical protein [Campylobacter pinnipediorum]AQW81055.1 hypothetical protein CPIN17260_0753 [Campylobacter pinnipediorum subsp. pinnipediorum]
MKNNKILFAFASILLLSVLDLSAERVTANYYKKGSGKNFSQFTNKSNRELSDGKGKYSSVSTKVKAPIFKYSRCYDEQYSEMRTENGLDGNYKDRAISFDYWPGYYPPDKKIWNYGCAKDSYFRFPFPMLVEFDKGNTYSSNGLYKWTSVWEGYIDIPQDGEWRFSLTIQGKALLTICDVEASKNKECFYRNSTTTYNKKYSSYWYKYAYGYNDNDAIIIKKLKKGDKLRFRLIYESADWSIHKTSSIHLKWINGDDINRNKGNCVTPHELQPPKTNRNDTSIFTQNGKCGMQIVDFEYKLPKSDIEYRVVEDEYVDAYIKNKGQGKDFDWLWNSPIRTKDIGDTNKFCIIMGTKDPNGKYIEIKENQNKIVGARIRYKDYQDKDTMRTLVNDKSVYMVRTPGSSKDMNKSKSCFRMTTVSEKLITKDAYFQVFEFQPKERGVFIVPDDFKKERTGTTDSDHFSFKPIGYTLSFSENGSNKKIEPTLHDKKLSNIADSVLYLTSGKTYTVTAKAQKKDIDSSSIKDITKYNSTDTSDGVTTVVGKYHAQIENNDSLLTPYLNGKTCQYKGKDLPDGKFNIKFYDNISNNFTSDINDDNVMRFKTNIVDKTWTAIDQTNDQDKISKYGYECKEPSKQIKGVNAAEFNRDLVDCYISNVVPAYVEFVPASFDITKSVENFNSSNFTYLNTLNADSYRMKAFLNIELAPKNAKNQDLSNFTKDCYAKDIGAVISYDGDKILKENKTENHSLIEDKKHWSWEKLNNAKRMKFAENGGRVVINMYNSEFDPNLYFSGVYSKYDPSSLVASAPYLFSKDLFEQNTAIAKIGFNFDKDYKKPENPFVIYNKEFSLDKLKIGDRVITDSGRKTEFKDIATLSTKNVNSSKNSYATMVYGRVTAPYQEGPKDGFDGKIYYTFYCDVDCSSRISSTLKGESIGNYVVNLSHNSDKFGHWDSYSTDDFGVWDGYSSMLKTNLVSISDNNSFGAPSRVKNGVEKVKFSNKESVKDTIKLKMSKAPWLIFNENYPTYDYNEIKVGFFGANGSWAGKSYDGKGEDKNNAGKFILDELPSGVDAPVRKNRRIDW